MLHSQWNRRSTLAGIAGAVIGASLPPRRAAAAAPSINFLVVGDWGRDGASHQRDVAKHMGRAASARGSCCIVSVGDNFYEHGVASAADPQWQSSYESVYHARSLHIPWYVALGNHDYRGSPQAQIDYAAQSSRWRMPARYFKVDGTALNAPYVDLFVIDTSPLVHKYRDEVEDAIAENVRTQDVDAQLQWLDLELGRSSARWKLVIGHHTLRSGGSGHGETAEVVQLVEPILLKHGVTAYINGHDHDLQHIRRGGLDCIGSGAGSEVRPVNAVSGTLFCASRSGFAAITCSPESVGLEFVDFTGAKLYRAAVASS
jgi:tartrate-resistant acid phosphatase type 5